MGGDSKIGAVELLPCPFCGGVPRTEQVWMDSLFIVKCRTPECFPQPEVLVRADAIPNSDNKTYSLDWEKAKLQGAEQWNRRFALPAPASLDAPMIQKRKSEYLEKGGCACCQKEASEFHTLEFWQFNYEHRGNLGTTGGWLCGDCSKALKETVCDDQWMNALIKAGRTQPAPMGEGKDLETLKVVIQVKDKEIERLNKLLKGISLEHRFDTSGAPHPTITEGKNR